MNRRAFLHTGTSCAAHLLLLGAALPPWVRRAFAARPVGTPVGAEPWGRIEKLADGVWALISTPLAGGPDARRTLANGGIVAGRSGTLLVEGFVSDAGAAWLAQAAQELTGRPPTHVVVTHYHGDHSAGLAAYRRAGGAPAYITTETTRNLLKDGVAQRPALAPVVEVLANAQLVSGPHSLTVDLGGKRVLVTGRSGHTPSDLSVAVAEPRVVFGGDLLWNGMFPNYRDAMPSMLSHEVRALLAEPHTTFVPGHGSVPSANELTDYVALLDQVESAARRAFAAGTPAEAAAREFMLPASLGTWHVFSDTYYRVALSAWEQELSAARAAPPGPLDQLAWLAGCWRMERGPRTTVERWQPASGGLMLGTSRTVVNGAVREFEQVQLRAEGQGVVYTAKPSGQAQASFTSVALSDSGFTVENPDHDFPQRIIYRRRGADSLLARIEGPGPNGPRGVDFPMRRVACGATGT